MGERIPDRWLFGLLFALLALLWSGSATGLLSSNDGSHAALARALALRSDTRIDPDRALTLGIDLAEREGHVYSDRPPGTAFAALPAVWLGDRLDGAALIRAGDQARAHEDVKPLPACPPYIATYAKRFPDAPPLAKRIATGVLIGLHATLLGLLGLALIDRLLVGLGTTRGARLFALASLGAATLWGPYSTALFAHVGTATALAGFLLGVQRLRMHEGMRAHAIACATGLAGAWAIACDYLVVLAVVPVTLLTIDWRRWPLVLLGSTPIVVATLAYHHAAFGSPFAIGYDFHSTFAFARERGSTFGGNPFAGLWILLGAGRGAGMLAQAPIALVGLFALGWFARRSASLAWLGKVGLGFVPWLLLLACHETPWGGGTDDHRYLLPSLPLAAIGLALAWDHLGSKPSKSWLRVVLVMLALVSALRVWTAFLAWREGSLLANADFGGLVALAVLAVMLVARRSQNP